MAHWQYSISLHGFTDDIPDFRAVACQIVDEISRVPGRDEELEELSMEFEDLATEVTADVDDFDDLLSRLYDWGDSDHRLWVGTH